MSFSPDWSLCLLSAAKEANDSHFIATIIYIYQINKHLHDIISDQILGVIEKNIPIISFQGQASRTQDTQRDRQADRIVCTDTCLYLYLNAP